VPFISSEEKDSAMPPVKPTSTESLRPKTAQPRAGENVVPRPTPTQEENDLVAAGATIDLHDWDGTPLQHTHGEPDRPDIPPPDGSGQQAPVLSSLSPPSAVSGDPTDITMVVNGSGFTPTSVIVMNSYDEPTTFVSTSKVSTGVKPSLFVVPASVPVLVRNGDKVSNELMFEFTAGAAAQQRSKK